MRSGSRGRLELIGGEAGVGKTSLLRRFCDGRQGATGRVLWGSCDALFTPGPLGPLQDVAQQTQGKLREVVESAERPWDVAAALIHELTARTPTILVLEDLHWADEATLDVLRMLARRIETVPALVLASYRDDVLERAHPLRLVLGEVATSQGVSRLSVPLLSVEAVAQLAAPHGFDAEELYRTTAPASTANGSHPFPWKASFPKKDAAREEAARRMAVRARSSSRTASCLSKRRCDCSKASSARSDAATFAEATPVVGRY